MMETTSSEELVQCNFQVTVNCSDDDSVYLTGTCAPLGCWKVEQLKLLRRKPEDSGVWTLSCELPTGTHGYRYVVAQTSLATCRSSRSPADQIPVVQEWETVQRSLVIKPCNDPIQVNDKYGLDSNGSSLHPDRGFMTSHSEIQIRVCRQKLEPLTAPVSFAGCPSVVDSSSGGSMCSLQVEPFWYSPRGSDDVDVKAACPPVESKTLVSSTGQCSSHVAPANHSASGWVDYSIDNVVVFSTRTRDLAHHAFKLRVRYRPAAGAAAEDGEELIGTGCILPEQVGEGTTVRIVVPLLNDHLMAIGSLVVHCLVVNALSKPPHDLSTSHSCTWDRSRCYRIGHRGMGASTVLQKDSASHVENTVSSFTAAGRHGADMVEFDVQLSSDLVPIVFHDFTFLIAANSQSDQRHEVRVQDCTLATLQAISVDNSYRPPADKKALMSVSPSIAHLDLELPVQAASPAPLPCLFPTLEEVLKRTPSNIGFDIELKYPVTFCDPPDVCEAYFDVNVFVDAILDVIFRYAGERQIFFSSFCPDTCICLRRKQCFYPVIFLSDVNAPSYEVPDDIRCASLMEALAFAHSERLPGLACESSVLVDNPAAIKDAIENHGMLMLSWSATNNVMENVNLQVQHGMHGIVSDAVDRLY
ncbi:glycerophosphocholine phosphodiesterase GPCPD1-like [Sycon ciliatum]|uniref:glycerophosphocholine phosphodiesterase GPCPD1-like n=1 Tax=Sycon ciliatum TaxID=27933 RepID=UPI0031F65E13